MSVFHAAADWAPAPTTDTASFPLPSPESIVLTTSPLARPRLLSLTSSRHLSSPATLIHHITARLDRMEVEVEPIIVDEGNRGKSDSCFLLLTPFVTARSFSPRTTATVPSLTLRPFRFLQSLSRSPRRVAGVACFLFGDGELVFRRKRN